MIVDLFTMILAKISEPSIQPPFEGSETVPHQRIRTSKGYCNKMLCIQLKKGFFSKVGKTYCVDNKAHERFCKEILTDKNDPSYEKRQKHKQHT